VKAATRDYKQARRGSIEPRRLRDFGYGLASGLVIALLVYVVMNQRALQAGARAADERPEPRPSAVAEAVAAEAESSATQYDFYEMLPKFEVVVPERERDVKRDLPAAPVERPGVYVLQAGSFRQLPDADRQRTQLARQGIDATVQRVAVDAESGTACVSARSRISPSSIACAIACAQRKSMRS
jgi:hypothetical protein